MYYIEQRINRVWVRLGGKFQFKFDAEAKISIYMNASGRKMVEYRVKKESR